MMLTAHAGLEINYPMAILIPMATSVAERDLRMVLLWKKFLGKMSENADFAGTEDRSRGSSMQVSQSVLLHADSTGYPMRAIERY